MDTDDRFTVRNILLFAFIFVIICFMLYCSVFTSDDVWFRVQEDRSVAGILETSACYGNGRFLGNTLIQFLVASKMIRTPIQALMIILFCYSLFLCARESKKQSPLLIIAMIMLMERTVFSETLIWCSGFCNYVPGIICMLISFYIVYSGKLTPMRMIVLFLFSVSGQLFVEHTSVVAVLASLLCLWYYCSKEPSDCRKRLSVVWLIGTAIGGGIMFLIPKIFGVPEWVQQYRSVRMWLDFSDISNVLYGILKNISVFTDVFFSNISLVSVIILLTVFCPDANNFNKAAVIASPIFVLVFNLLCAGRDTWTYHHLIYNTVWIPYLCSTVGLLIKDRQIKGRSLAIASLGLGAVSLGPHFLFKGSDCRTTLQAMVLIILAVAVIFYRNDFGSRFRKLVTVTSSCLIIAVSIVMVISMYDYRIKAIERNDYISDCMKEGNDLIFIPFFDNAYAYDKNYDWACDISLYYEEPGDINFVSVDYNDWLAER